MSTVYEAIKKRFSTRGYTDEKLTDEELNQVIDAGLAAPTAANKQELHFSVIPAGNPILQEIEDEKNKTRGPAPKNFYYDAPTVIIISGDESFGWSALDAGIAAQNIVLAAEGLGLGSLIIGCIKDAMLGEKKAYFNEKLGIPEGYGYQIVIALGHTALAKEPHSYDPARQVSCL